LSLLLRICLFSLPLRGCIVHKKKSPTKVRFAGDTFFGASPYIYVVDIFYAFRLSVLVNSVTNVIHFFHLRKYFERFVNNLVNFGDIYFIKVPHHFFLQLIVTCFKALYVLYNSLSVFHVHEVCNIIYGFLYALRYSLFLSL
jgi:hypothetical protein